MSSVAVVSLASLEICLIYSGPANQGSYGGDWGSPQVTIHMEVPEGLDPRCLMAVRSDDGTIQLIEDPSKVAQKTEAAWAALRTERNRRLQASDYTQLADAHLSLEKKQAWADYRQALRDLPEEATDPFEVEWPVDPTQAPAPAPTGSRIDNLLSQA